MRGPAEAAVYTAATRFLVAGPVRQPGHQHGRPAPVHRDVRPGRPAGREPRLPGHDRLADPADLAACTCSRCASGRRSSRCSGHSYQAGAAVIVILGLTMLLATGCGQVDMVLVTTGRSSWSLVNGLLAVGVNVGLDVLLIPALRDHRRGDRLVRRHRPDQPHAAGPGGGDRAAPPIRPRHLHRRRAFRLFLRRAAAYRARALFGPGVILSLLAIGCGCAVMAVGMWHFRTDLELTAMPGAAQLAALRAAAK